MKPGGGASRMLGVALILMSGIAANAQRQMENLGRGVVAIHQDGGKVFVSWRLLATDPGNIAFNLYRTVGGSPPMKLNAEPLAKATCCTDSDAKLEQPTSYFVRTVLGGKEGPASVPFSFKANAPVQPYLSIPLQLPPGYSPNDASVGDLDGDGEYEIVLKSEQHPRDTASTGLTGQTILQGYKIDGTLLWTIDLGKNIREGAHYTQFIVYDLDGDGIAEIACKTADGTVDGKGKVIGDADVDWRDTNSASRTFGRILKGPEYFTIFDGRTGAALATTNYIPPRGDLGGWGGIGGNGGNDNVGNRVDRFLACVAYLDGARPSVVMCRGYYGRSVLAAWDWRNGRLTSRWVFDSKEKDNPYSGQGGHQLSVADVDGDGRDEIIYHAMVVDDDGRGLYTTGLRHGDALHVGDLDPDRPGLEVFGIHENEERTVRFGTPGTALFDAKTGEIIWSDGPGIDVGRGLTADIDPRHPGEEMWSGPAGLRTCKGEKLGPAPRTTNFAVWWDGDLLRELLDRNQIYKWDWEKGRLNTLLTAEGCVANNGTKATPCLSADILGDWREEVIWRTTDNKELRIYTTTIPTEHRFYTLMHDPQYRLSVAWQNVGYNQPLHPGFYLGDGMKPPPRPNIVMIRQTAVERHGRLRVEGNHIVDQHGQTVVLRGMSLFWSQWIGRFYNSNAVQWLRDDWHCTVVRAAMAVEPDGYLAHPEQERQKTKAVIQAAIDLGLYVILDWHDHNAHRHTEQAQAFFGEIAAAYGRYPNIIYEPWNEPLKDHDWSNVIKPYHEAVIAKIRVHDPDNLIICGTQTWSQDVDKAARDPLQLTNVAYTLHFYAATHRQRLRDKAMSALTNGIALMVTECGTSEASGGGKLDREEMRKWWDFMDQHQLSWCNWSLADKRETSAALNPGASSTGGWSTNDLSPSGLLVREELRAKNPAPPPAGK